MHDLWIMCLYIGLLLVAAIADIRKLRIPMYVITLIYIVSIVIVVLLEKWKMPVSCIVLPLLPGVIMIVIGLITRQKIGIGDGVIVAGIGIGIGMDRCLAMLMFALFAVALVAGAMIACGRVNKHTRIPFVPFILGGLGMSMLIM